MARELVTLSRDIKTYTPKDWLDEKGAPEVGALVFKYKPLSKRQLATFADNSSRLSIQSNTILLGNAVNSIDVFKMAVTGWDNLLVDGANKAFEKDANGLVAESAIEDIPLDIIEEVATHIVHTSKFPEVEVKK
jgi:hypothetical protein